MGRNADAEIALKHAIEIVRDDPVLYEHLGDVYSAMGQKDNALKAWEKSLKLSEKEEGLKERVEQKIKNLNFQMSQ